MRRSRWLSVWLNAASLTVAVLGIVPMTPAAAQTPVASQPQEGSFSLREALRQARSQSAARQAAAVRVEAADLSRRFSGQMPNPTSELRWENMAPGLGHRLPLDVFATVTQPVELGGKRHARRSIADAVFASSRAALFATEQWLDADVARLYLAVIAERERSRVLVEHADGLAEPLRILERRVAEGVTAEADLRKLEVERARVDADAALSRLAAMKTLSILVALVGWTSMPTLDALTMPALSLIEGASELVQADEALIAGALDRRPDVRLAAARVETARQTLRFEQARGVPDLNLTGGYKRTTGYDTGVVALVLPIPLFERNRATIALAAGNARAAELELAQTRRQAIGQARAALAAAHELTRRNAVASARLVDPANQVRTAARAAFASGAGDLLRLVDAERVYADARLAVTDLSNQALVSIVEARLALAEDPMP